MKEIPFVGGAYESRSIPADHQRCVNLFVETDGAGGDPQLLLGTPGLVLQYTLPTGPVRGGDVMNGRTFLVGGNTLYETTSGTPAAIGTLQTMTGPVSVTNNDDQLLLVDGVGGYVYDGTTFSLITDPDFPNGVTRAAWEGQFFIVGCDGSKQFFISDLGTGSSWNGLDFASAENKPEILVSLVVNHDRLILFSMTGTEQWQNTGDGEFAFQRDNGSSIEVGCEARESVVTMNNGVYWLGRDRDGGGMVFTLQGAVPQRISTHAIEHLLQSVDRSDAYALAYQQEGHSFYCLTVPALERTFCFDAATQKWAERGFWNASRAFYSRWRAAMHLFNGKHLVGDYQSGKVYALDLDVPTDDGMTIRRLRTSAPLKNGLARQTFHRFQLDIETGTASEGLDSAVMLRYSNDGGRTWSDERRKSLGTAGRTRQRVFFQRCGIGRDRVWEIAITDAVRVAIAGAYVDAELEAA